MWRRREKTGTALYDESGCNMDMTRRSPGCGAVRTRRRQNVPEHFQLHGDAPFLSLL